jgi:hypothetical protein
MCFAIWKIVNRRRNSECIEQRWLSTPNEKECPLAWCPTYKLSRKEPCHCSDLTVSKGRPCLKLDP